MTKSKKPRKRRFWLTLILVLALFPFVGVALFAIVPPTPTILMLRQVVRGEGLDYQWRGLNDISPNLVNAVIASEDARFCSHNGFDMDAIQKALDHNADGGRMRGGSTISQQTAKNVFLWPSRDWVRKGLEAGYTVLIETFWGKRRIMEVYLNVVEWAPGVYGAQAASQHWFNKNARDLTPREAARLAAILPAPRRYQAADPGPYVRRRGARVQAAMGTVRGQGLSACVLR
ncbi:monofunctional biosynthetic peptidoglycan transglycosylase [Brevundimonas nasdae]|uniref:Biosynthetic peptidoglycan transglycosylase n=1 Tax=Brevundimonas nasdae TaxID=172043 RepID=A0ABX8TF13_9CAUL|nr:monofunctional biosynthetic peptidoglycan transglycosylase [Brevundimonas nasdae]QYC09781.1 monofunctional biosynthetic peptidoglycan transglycosylase [Brevundimonas nasdae]QYC12569.1 monofunctional biosynthetic peptidoglycan transglycosylase [Brevundimonas nasdae]